MREKLLPLAKQFFKINSDIKQIFITEDHHCWYSEIEAKRFCKGEKKYEQFTPADLEAKPQVKSEAKPKAEKKTAPKKEE